ncbi:hypothetical protein [Demequina sediminicola]|uniref:hypothetical protein n=1 Tax=Demequina sediminicola TaxID=1095026 RepID=UPI000A92FAEE|nr:hypothetical protein [Demequina sediminicola]
MKQRQHRRILAATLAGGALLLTGCAVPGQEGSPASAVEYHDEVITNERVADLFSAWTNEAHVTVDRRSVVTLELLREPLLERVDELGVSYSRDTINQIADVLKQQAGVEGVASDELVDAVEASFLVATYVTTPQGSEILAEIVTSIGDDAVSSTRTGEWSEEEFTRTVEIATPMALEKAQAGDVRWIADMSVTKAFVDVDQPWVAGE